jgi:hypothetical protein
MCDVRHVSVELSRDFVAVISRHNCVILARAGHRFRTHVALSSIATFATHAATAATAAGVDASLANSSGAGGIAERETTSMMRARECWSGLN